MKNIPHFVLLSYIGAELFVRFFYDSIYLPLKRKGSIWSPPIGEDDEVSFARAYVTQLLSRGHRSQPMAPEQSKPSRASTESPEEVLTADKSDRARVQKVLDSIYQWNDNFRFSTMATCTYTVAFVFLYYLTCSFIFLYVSRTTGHTSSLKAFVEYMLQIGQWWCFDRWWSMPLDRLELEGPFSFHSEIIFSAVVTALIYGYHLIIGMRNYKKHRIQLRKRIYEDIPSPIQRNISLNKMPSYAVHHSGFLVSYMAWGFVICFHLILIIAILFRLVRMQIRVINLTSSIIIPIVLVYMLKMASMTSIGRFLVIRQSDSNRLIKDRESYAIFVYFSFFAGRCEG